MVPDSDDESSGVEETTQGRPTPDSAPMDRPTPTGWSSGSVRANGIDVASYRTGDPDGETVVATHGFYEDARCLRPVVDALADDGYDVVAFDARGHGHTDAPESGYAVDDRVADLVGVLDALDLQEPVLYGHSMGGGTVAAVAARHGDRVRAAIMEDPSSLRGTPDQDLDEVAEYVREQVADARSKSHDDLVAENAEEFPEHAEWFARANARLDEAIAEQAREPPALVDELLADVDVPALVLRRDVDRDERVHDLEIVDGFDDVRLVHVPDAGHHVVLDEPAAAFAEVRAFLDYVAE